MNASSPVTSRKLRVFLCHASPDKIAVRTLYDRLREEGFLPWLDEENLLPGQDWQLEIAKVVRFADIVLVCISRNSISRSGFVNREIKYALDVSDQQPEGTIYVIPVRLEDCTVPERLQKWHWVDLFAEKGYQKLRSSLIQRANALGIAVPPVPSAEISRTKPLDRKIGSPYTGMIWVLLVIAGGILLAFLIVSANLLRSVNGISLQPSTVTAIENNTIGVISAPTIPTATSSPTLELPSITPTITPCVLQQTPIDLLLLLDRSASMTAADGLSKLDAVKSAALFLVRQMDLTRDQVALFTFDTGVTMLYPLGRNQETLNSQLQEFPPGGGTDIYLALQESWPELVSRRRNQSAQAVLLLVSDGRSFTNETESFVRISDEINDAGIRIITVALGEDADAALLELIATSPNDVYYAERPEDVRGVFIEIVNSLIIGC